jgi:hypothetical protein
LNFSAAGCASSTEMTPSPFTSNMRFAHWFSTQSRSNSSTARGLKDAGAADAGAACAAKSRIKVPIMTR